MEVIKCFCGEGILVDASAYNKLMELSSHWHCGEQIGVRTCVKGKTITMSWLILGEPPNGYLVDHRDRNKHNNQRENLRYATTQQNSCNREKNRDKKTYKGVLYVPKRPKPYRAIIVSHKTNIHLGYFATQEEAALAYNDAAIRHHGEFACLNVIQDPFSAFL